MCLPLVLTQTTESQRIRAVVFDATRIAAIIPAGIRSETFGRFRGRPNRIGENFQALRRLFKEPRRDREETPAWRGPGRQDPPPKPRPRAPNRRWSPSARRLLAVIFITQLGIEPSHGVVLPLLMRARFGGFSAMTRIGSFSMLAAVAGRYTGSRISRRLGIKRTWLVAQTLRLLAVLAVIASLQGPSFFSSLAAHCGLSCPAPPAWLRGFCRSDSLEALTRLFCAGGFAAGVAAAAEEAVPIRLLGQDEAELQGFFSLEQCLLETAGVLGLKVGSLILRSWGYAAALCLYPASLLTAIKMFLFGVHLPKDRSSPAAKRGKTQPAKWSRGIAVVFSDPLIRRASLAYAAYMILSPVLYHVLAIAYGVLIAHGSAASAAGASSHLAALCSLGELFGALAVWRESTLIVQARERRDIRLKLFSAFRFERVKKPLAWLIARIDGLLRGAYLGRWIQEAGANGQLDGRGEGRILDRSAFLWMKWGMLGVLALATMPLRIPWLTYAAMIPFGFVQAVVCRKLFALIKSRAPPNVAESAAAFVLAASSILVATSENLLGRLFDAFPGPASFVALNAALVFLAAAQWRLRSSLRYDLERRYIS